ncbi:conserved membrane hypothetical protein [Candidatus Nitrotoga sp. HW29]|uniref:hypothetical protein n=1 Tax=Candidatus Nitrotoga sp. HW29 TaxID=2886963 RepID=UPI001EF31BA1|nr:hypothetical protein [Candidatus Nitrotoga sp. HW29]CAH1903564.1 conserved membrane hypothetical protein [Candidatus Nitrotoga sp. HW29]
MKDFFSKYSREARVYPTIIGLVPFYILQYYYLADLIPSEVFTVKLVGNATFAVVILYLVSEFFVRFPSKLLEDKIFKNKRDFPTTRFLLSTDKEYSSDFKNTFRKKVARDFSLNLSDPVEEVRNEDEARRKIKEAVGLIIKRVSDGHLVLKHNISYGFFRNLWGASLVGLILSFALTSVLVFKNNTHTYLGVFLILAYLMYVVFGRFVIRYFGEAYSRKLLEEYMEERLQK